VKLDRYLDTWWMACWVVGGLFAGAFIGGLICFVQPKLYASTAVVAEAGHGEGGEKIALAHVQALKIVRTLYLDKKWGLPIEQAAQKLSEGLVLQTAPEGVSIEVRHANKEDARDIAREAAWVFRGTATERNLGNIPVKFEPYAESQSELVSKRARLGTWMDDLAREAGVNGFMVVSRNGGASEQSLWNSEDFQQRRKTYLEWSEQLDPIPGTEGSEPLPLLKQAELPQGVVSPIPWIYTRSGGLCGLLAGSLIGVARQRKRAAASAAKGPAAPAAPAAAPTVNVEETW
jgi:hypothetical protein